MCAREGRARSNIYISGCCPLCIATVSGLGLHSLNLDSAKPCVVLSPLAEITILHECMGGGHVVENNRGNHFKITETCCKWFKVYSNVVLKA